MKNTAYSACQVEAEVYHEIIPGRIAAVYNTKQELFGAPSFTLVPKDNFRTRTDAKN